jgi:hypothetical protein
LDSISYDVEVDTNGDPMLVLSYIDYYWKCFSFQSSYATDIYSEY